MKAKTWNMIVLAGSLGILLLIAACTMMIDPFLHYHKPLAGLEYPLKDERYQNDGIARWFDYNAVITGTSMTQNFKTSEWDELMGVTSIKIAYSGATYHELNNSMERALKYNPDIKLILCSIDGNRLLCPADQDEYEGYPEYFFDENPFNDVNYLLNKEVLPKTLAVLNYTRAGEKTPTMDQYGSWSQYKTFGKEAVEATLVELPEIEEEVLLTEADIAMIEENVTKNFLDLAQENPQTEFYFFFPPYSIYFWEALADTKQLNMQIHAELIATELLVQADNVHLFGFADRTEIVKDLNNYTDALHYSAEINSEILKMISNGEGEITKDNYQEYYQTIKALYEK